jgi:hypothetical protein
MKERERGHTHAPTHPHTQTHVQQERERETDTDREREREREYTCTPAPSLIICSAFVCFGPCVDYFDVVVARTKASRDTRRDDALGVLRHGEAHEVNSSFVNGDEAFGWMER